VTRTLASLLVSVWVGVLAAFALLAVLGR